MDLPGARMLHELHKELSVWGIELRVVAARGLVRDLLRADGVTDKVGAINRHLTIDSLLKGENQAAPADSTADRLGDAGGAPRSASPI
jgi:sulfate permease, SulP family